MMEFRDGREISREEKRDLTGMFEAVEGQMGIKEAGKGKRKRWRKKDGYGDGEDEMSG